MIKLLILLKIHLQLIVKNVKDVSNEGMLSPNKSEGRTDKSHLMPRRNQPRINNTDRVGGRNLKTETDCRLSEH